jgi:radical SAM protein with 4Fe4S-binding SPASM domain
MIRFHTTTEIRTIQFDIVGGCQLRCVGCPNSTLLPKVTRIDPLVFATCLRNIDVQRVRLLRLFNYGEPLLHDDLPSVFDALVTAPGFAIGLVEISTNAQSVRWDQLENVIRRGRLNHLVVSCDGDGTPPSYERFRPPSKWEKLIEFLKKARELRERHCPSLELMTRTVVFNRADIARWQAVLAPLGWRPEFRRWKNLVGGAENFSGRDWRPGQGVCKFLEPGQLYVGSDGTVIPCCAHPGAGRFGNLRTEKWSDIFVGKARLDFIKELRSERESMEICGKCEYGPAGDPGPSAGSRVDELT